MRSLLLNGPIAVGSLVFLALACTPRQRQYGDDTSVGGAGAGAAGAAGDDSGGASSVKGSAKGGTSAKGGSNGKGGTVSRGGAASVVGSTSTGGTAATGGVASGTVDVGGTTSAGGSAATGGTVATGGSSATSVVPCAATDTMCSGTCVDITSSAADCGACGHDCGLKSSCVNSRCQPAALVTDLVYAQGMDVSPKGIFYSSNATIQHCTNFGNCPSYTTQVGAPGSASTIAVTKSLVVDMVGFEGRALVSSTGVGYHYCPASGCGTTTISTVGNTGYVGGLKGVGGDLYYHGIANASLISTSFIYRLPGTDTGAAGAKVTIGNQASNALKFAVDEKYVYYLRTDSAGANPNIVACDRLVGCTSYTTLVAGTPTNLAAYGGKLYFSNGIVVKQVSATDPSSVATVTTLKTSYEGDMLVDGTNIYWLTSSAIVYCSLPSCTGGAKNLVTGLSGATTLRESGKFVYWLVPSASGASTGAVYRVAKP